MTFFTEADFTAERSIAYLVRRSGQLAVFGMERLFAENDLSFVQWSVLATIGTSRANTAADLAREFGHDKGAMTRLIDGLEGRGFLERRREAGDRRRNLLELTEEGRAVALAVKRRIVAQWNDWLADWQPEDVEQLLASLRRLRDTLAAATGERR